MTQLVDTSWSPSKTEHIVGTQQVAQDASEVLFAVVQKELAKYPGNNEQKQVIKQRTLELSRLIEEFVAEASKGKIAELEAELEKVCAEGEAAEVEFVTAKNKELAVRNAEAKRLDRYDKATRNLTNIKNEPLPTFHTNRHVTRKLERIADAQDEVASALEDMNANPLAVPIAVQAKMDAQQRVNQLGARARQLRREIASLKGEDAHITDQQRSGLGLAG